MPPPATPLQDADARQTLSMCATLEPKIISLKEKELEMKQLETDFQELTAERDALRDRLESVSTGESFPMNPR